MLRLQWFLMDQAERILFIVKRLFFGKIKIITKAFVTDVTEAFSCKKKYVYMEVKYVE